MKKDYYTIEFHRSILWDQAFPMDTVLIHLVKQDGLSYLVEPGRPNGWQSGDGYVNSNRTIFIKVNKIDQLGVEIAFHTS